MNIVLINPEIPFNTGNIGRSCVATGTKLHLVGKLGFKIEDKEIRRSGLDYWVNLDYKTYKDFDGFLSSVENKESMFFFSTKGKKSFWDIKYPPDSYLIFGSESCGFPKEIYETYKEKLFTIPMTGPVRSLNLSTSAGVVLFEALRQQR
ncbi:Putative tRNA/rRNA methyltransferase (SpoU) [Elusimicrobium minutum Pei191]|uniref:Putative tRNA (cytidine(34)-2'-O)-methyltransferase n=1 Tax=Elusimicrobium minutum (strain Pei191) TaxID=445932 RepID=B2KBS9_ELUMP|nr:tRNA (cytidine(34)-2'-O)-methyltransferase [Elusimicrobium minutum]ACC97833.1 Putative tRNA/rRNA methyltransferase (SpoU) [Elusimicrobium minutum Pei191]